MRGLEDEVGKKKEGGANRWEGTSNGVQPLERQLVQTTGQWAPATSVDLACLATLQRTTG